MENRTMKMDVYKDGRLCDYKNAQSGEIAGLINFYCDSRFISHRNNVLYSLAYGEYDENTFSFFYSSEKGLPGKDEIRRLHEYFMMAQSKGF
jgi:hypothetical protein